MRLRWVLQLSLVVVIESHWQVMQLIGVGEGNRHTAATAMNEASSRSHSVFIIETVQKFKDGSTKSGKLCLADLAGSERVKRSKVWHHHPTCRNSLSIPVGAI